ncbi:MAG: peptidoglycan DD-metalloendopeptidase family protein [bacterium]
MRGWVAWTALAAALVLLAGCDAKRQVSPPPVRKAAKPIQVPALDTPQEKAQGTYHVVKKGETLWRICRAYGADLQQVAEINNIRDPSQIREGQKIFIPGASGATRVELPKGPVDKALEAEPKIQLFVGKLIWPVRGQVSSSFGVRNGMKHSGIDITAPLGTPVVAAAEGEVMYKGQLRGYGNILILRHSEELATVYAHLNEIRASEHQRVRQGETIGTVGNSGQSEGAHLHFEVRVKNVARNPLFYLSENAQ